MAILKGACAVTFQKVYETILSIMLFRFTYSWVKVICNYIGFGGIYAFFLGIFVNSKIRNFLINKYNIYKKKYFSKYVDNFVFENKYIITHDLKTIFSSSPPPPIPIGAVGLVPELTKDDCRFLRSEFTELKNEMEENLFSFIFHSATRSSLINLFTIIFVEYLSNSHQINIFASLAICISTAFIVSFISSLNYAKLVAKDWQEIVNDIEDKDSHKRKPHKKNLLVVYNPTALSISIGDNAAEAEKKIAESQAGKENAQQQQQQQKQQQPQQQSKKDKKSNKQTKQQQQQPVKNDTATAEASADKQQKQTAKEEPKKETQKIIGIISSEIENEEHLKVKLILFNKKFEKNVHEVVEHFFSKRLPHLLVTLPGQAQKPGLNQLKTALNDFSNLMQNFFLIQAAQIQQAVTNDTYFTTKTLKTCTFYATDYYDIEGNLAKYFRLKGFKLQEKWAEFTLFLWIKFKVYEYKKDFVSLAKPNPPAGTNPAVPGFTPPKLDLQSLFKLPPLNANAAATGTTPAAPIPNLFQNLKLPTLNTNLLQTATTAATANESEGDKKTN